MNSFIDNPLYHDLSKTINYSEQFLAELNSILHEQPELAELTDPIQGSFFHLICRNFYEDENVAHRMIYALSNAGANPNVTDGKGNTPLHTTLMRDAADIRFDIIQALFRVGVDPRIKNNEGRTADSYLDDNPQLIAAYNAYKEGIWSAIETSDLQETERLVKGFIKIDCKSPNKTTLLDKARDLNNSSIIRLLADYQVTIEFVHSILACDWQRASLIHQYQSQFIKINASDSIHVLSWARTKHRTYSESILQICLDTCSPSSLDLIFSSSTLKPLVDVNVLGTDGLPFFFHVFDSFISEELRNLILSTANFQKKSSKGETFLFHLIFLYQQNSDEQYLTTWKEIVEEHPMLLTQRNEHGRTMIDVIELTPATVYEQLRPFYQTIENLIENQWTNIQICERFILNNFGFHLLLFANDSSAMEKNLRDLLQSVKYRQGLVKQIDELRQAIAEDNLIKVQQLCKTRLNLVFARDWSGRTCAHLAVLYRRRSILSYFCEQFNSITNLVDNLNRTPLHYASIMNDESLITNLQKFNAKKLSDCFDLYPADYLVHRDLCSEEFHAQSFPKQELRRDVSGLSDYLKLAFYSQLREAIEQNQVEQIKSLNTEMNSMGFFLNNLDPNSYLNDWLKGQRYMPLLFVALEYHSVSSVQCLMELGLTPIGRMYMTKSNENRGPRCVSVRSRAEELECFDIIGIINDLEDDHELKNVFKRHLSSTPTTPVQSSSTNLPQQSIKRQKIPETVESKAEQKKTQVCVLS